MGRGRRKFSPEFKEETVRLIIEGGHSISEVAKDLGIRDTVIRRWKKKYEEDPRREYAFPGKGRMTPPEEELRRLRRENLRLREEKEILKKAISFLPRKANELRVH